jgi:probable rRNA maturation factor
MGQFDIDVQYIVQPSGVPNSQQIHDWLQVTLAAHRENAELTVRIVGEDEITQLNHDYRGQSKPTNVLSFPFEVPDEVEDCHLLGDVVICADVVEKEARQQGKTHTAHWAHMIVHGACHLLGYDHIDDAEAIIMEKLEVKILAQLGFKNPYLTTQGNNND